MISHKTTNGILVNFEKLIILNYDFLYAAIEKIQFHVLFKEWCAVTAPIENRVNGKPALRIASCTNRASNYLH